MRPLTDAQSALAAKHKRLAYWAIRRALEQNPHLADEIESEALYALCMAARNFRAGGPATFATYAVRVVNRAVFQRLRLIAKFRRLLPHEDAVAPAFASEIEARVSAPKIKAKLVAVNRGRTLARRERAVAMFVERLDGERQVDVARKYGVSPRNADFIIGRVREDVAAMAKSIQQETA